MYLKREIPEFVQYQVEKTVHRCTLGRIRLAHKVRQRSEMPQTYDAASPDGHNTAGITYRCEPLQVLHQVAGVLVQGMDQRDPEPLPTVRVLRF